MQSAKKCCKLLFTELYFNTYILQTDNLEPPPPHVKIRHHAFFIFYNRVIKLSIFIVKFIGSISTKDHTIDILNVNLPK